MTLITNMKDLDYYTNIGKESFDLKGTELRQWVSEEMRKDEQREAEEAEKKAAEAEQVRQHDLELTRHKEEERN